jgi:hypothetical protein
LMKIGPFGRDGKECGLLFHYFLAHCWSRKRSEPDFSSFQQGKHLNSSRPIVRPSVNLNHGSDDRESTPQEVIVILAEVWHSVSPEKNSKCVANCLNTAH